AALRADEAGVRLVEGEQGLGVLAEAEEVALLFDALDGLLVVGAEVAGEELFFRLEGLAADAVPVLVLGEVDVPGGLEALPEARREGLVARLGRADEVVVLTAELDPGL